MTSPPLDNKFVLELVGDGAHSFHNRKGPKNFGPSLLLPCVDMDTTDHWSRWSQTQSPTWNSIAQCLL
jgi:hypothetical protein